MCLSATLPPVKSLQHDISIVLVQYQQKIIFDQFDQKASESVHVSERVVQELAVLQFLEASPSALVSGMSELRVAFENLAVVRIAQ